MDGAGSQRPGEQMADLFLELLRTNVARPSSSLRQRSGRPLHLLDKDVWVVWILRCSIPCPICQSYIFKEARRCPRRTQIIGEFSEDVDLTYDIRAIAPDLVGGAPNHCSQP